MLTVDARTRPVWARLMILAATMVIAAALVVAFAPAPSPSNEVLSGALASDP